MTQLKDHPEYWATEDGIVYSMINNAGNKRQEPRQLAPALGRDGYLWVGLKGSNKRMKKIHRLVAETFIPNPDNKPVVNHIDGNKQNNEVANLEWVTYSENTQHAIATGLLVPAQGETHSCSKLLDSETRALIQGTLDGFTNEELGEMYSLHPRYVSLIRHKKRQLKVWNTYFKDTIAIASNKDAKTRNIAKAEAIVVKALHTSDSNAAIACEFGIDAATVSRIRSGNNPQQYFLPFILKHSKPLTTIESTSSEGSE